MKLIELAEKHLDQEILREVVEEDLNISLPKGMDTPEAGSGRFDSFAKWPGNCGRRRL